ncbi:hypothetical protein DE146DRAFT_655590 [Phaeosphaeria sp. MPI-PUGE-AT-0046c]|nr:hypothetical protein DE146DRAFT_655590 [Phaeosphaeria sp. MPI-PUGE-AT-0046c]
MPSQLVMFQITRLLFAFLRSATNQVLRLCRFRSLHGNTNSALMQTCTHWDLQWCSGRHHGRLSRIESAVHLYGGRL